MPLFFVDWTSPWQRPIVIRERAGRAVRAQQSKAVPPRGRPGGGRLTKREIKYDKAASGTRCCVAMPVKRAILVHFVTHPLSERWKFWSVFFGSNDPRRPKRTLFSVSCGLTRIVNDKGRYHSLRFAGPNWGPCTKRKIEYAKLQSLEPTKAPSATGGST
jgi:hypothetical protein